MPEPQPKCELYIVLQPPYTLQIYAHSRAAREWIKEEAGKYGAWSQTIIEATHSELVVYPTFSFSEVAVWLQSMGKE